MSFYDILVGYQNLFTVSKKTPHDLAGVSDISEIYVRNLNSLIEFRQNYPQNFYTLLLCCYVTGS